EARCDHDTEQRDRHFFFSSRRRHTSFSRDWSSDVCSSDLAVERQAGNERTQYVFGRLGGGCSWGVIRRGHVEFGLYVVEDFAVEIGRASCRERVEIAVVAVA